MAITTQADLEGLIAAATQESLALEYKRCAALQNNEASKNELSKDVSAFANSAGGELIYGVIENANVPTAIEGFDPAGQIKREWIDQVIGSRIQPKIQGIVIRPIALAGANNGRVAFALEIPQSHTAHQASDKKYYKRRNFTVEPMEDYEIRDVLNRAKTPLLVPRMRASRVPGGQADRFLLDVSITNEGDVSARTIRLELGIPSMLITAAGNGQSATREARNNRDGRDYREDVYIYLRRDTMIFPQQQISLASDWGVLGPTLIVDAELLVRAGGERVELRWVIYADDMRKQEGQIAVFPDVLNY